MIARVPVYGTTNVGRNLYLRIKEKSSREFGLRVSQILSALYVLTDDSGSLCVALCAHVDDFFWAARGEHAIQRLLRSTALSKTTSAPAVVNTYNMRTAL